MAATAAHTLLAQGHPGLLTVGKQPDSASYVEGPACRMEEEAEFKAYAAQPNLHERIFAKVAPNIFGHADIKKAVACLLFGGARKVSATPVPPHICAKHHLQALLC